MKTPSKHNRRVPVSIWEEEHILGLPILHLQPRRSARARDVKPPGQPRLRQRLITLGQPRLPEAVNLSKPLTTISVYVKH